MKNLYVYYAIVLGIKQSVIIERMNIMLSVQILIF